MVKYGSHYNVLKSLVVSVLYVTFVITITITLVLMKLASVFVCWEFCNIYRNLMFG